MRTAVALFLALVSLRCSSVESPGTVDEGVAVARDQTGSAAVFALTEPLEQIAVAEAPPSAPAPPTAGALEGSVGEAQSQVAAPGAAPTETTVMDPGGSASERLVWGDTEHVRRLAPPDDASLAIDGVDLGVTFVDQGALRILFGDTWSVPSLWERDPVATVHGAGPDDLSLSWHRAEGGAFAPIGFSQPVGTGAFEVPVDGLVVGDRTYVFYATDFDADAYRHGTSVLAHTRDGDFSELAVDHAAPSERFINISAVADHGEIWLFGSGSYRQSAVYLARATPGTLPDRNAWKYWAGLDAAGSRLASSEMDAAPLIDSECVGELSVRRDPRRELYLMTYNCIGAGQPRGVHLRVAKAPWGPWSEPVVIFEPERDGYGQIMHRAVCGEPGAADGCVDEDDGLSDPGREGEWGGEYGPYLIEPWIEAEQGLLTLYYTLSSWNPYAVHLMKTTLVRQG